MSNDTYPQEDTKNKRRIYTLEGLTPEVKAVCFAKCSRSPESFDEIAKELTEEKSSEFHEKWVVGYGHSSVAEHAIISIALENISILATKVVEDNRLASYTEKSTRYQVFDKNRYLKPERIMKSDLKDIYERAGDYLFQVYEALSEPMMEFIKKKDPKKPDMGEKMYNSICKAKVCDNVRYLLPASTQTNLGMTINARNLDWAITKLMSHPLEEMQEIGTELKEVASKVTPTLEKFADKNPYLMETDKELAHLSSWLFNNEPAGSNLPVKLVDYDKDAENKLVSALLYRNSNLPYSQIKSKIEKIPNAIKTAIIDEALKRRNPFDRPLRELEHIYYTFDTLMDYGAFRDVQRHRMATQTNQKVTIEHGFSIPDDIIEAGYETGFKNAMAVAEEAYHKIYKQFPDEAQYIIPLAFRKRTLFTWNLRELHHFIPLRSGKKGHISYRRIAQECWREIERVHPLLAKYIRVDLSDETVSTAGSK
ncbi:FAD-dependent thymidylate synthase [Patescibacteria group bacterium]|nr:FAD-dependent thymidylate synthase [Patescibacteria group bacterium]